LIKAANARVTLCRSEHAGNMSENPKGVLQGDSPAEWPAKTWIEFPKGA
jgi:hypothetical protein